MPTKRTMRGLLTDGILLRSIVATLLVFVVVGIGTVTYTAYATGQQAIHASNTRLNQLLDTVESTLRVACYVKDDVLAKEVARGLLSNTEVLRVTIQEGSHNLADMRRRKLSAQDESEIGDVLQRDIASPFRNEKIIGKISLTPDPAAIAQQVREDVLFAVIQLGWQLALIAFTVVGTLVLFVVRPISAMSEHLHHMDPTTGERLTIPTGHARTEIGRLAGYFNALADRLVRALDEEHTLRLQREFDERKYHAIFDNAESGIFIVDRTGLVSSWNPAFARLMQLSAVEHHHGSLSLQQLPWQDLTESSRLFDNAFASNTAASQDILICPGNSPPRWINITLSLAGKDRMQGVVHDVSELKEAEAQARRQAMTDPLTGLANRAGLELQLRNKINQYLLTLQHGFTLLIVNLDKFRYVIEGIGMPAGDEILRSVASRLSGLVTQNDTLARLNADVFCIVLQDLSHDNTINAVVSRIVAALRQPYLVEGSPVQLYASIGIVLFPNDGSDSPTLLRHAELAMDKAKEAGGNSAVFFDPALAEAAERRRHLENDLRLAIRDNHFVLFFQPIVDIQRNRLSGAEALIRWRHPNFGFIEPDQFIPLAEETGLINDIGLWVFENACKQLQAWQRAGKDYYLSINVSGNQIPNGLPPEVVAEAIQRYGIAPKKLAVEITEGVLLNNIEEAVSWLQAIHDIGLRVYLDDFGTGYSSLSYLKRFPLETIKIDKSFILDMRFNGSERSLVQAIIAMAHSLELTVVAEGVETEDHLLMLREMGCHFAQGYYFSKPVPAEDFGIVAKRSATLLAALPPPAQPPDVRSQTKPA